jgi:serine protease Do
MNKGFDEAEERARMDAASSEKKNETPADTTLENDSSVQNETVSTVYLPKTGQPFTYPESKEEHANPPRARTSRRSYAAIGAVLLTLCLILGIVGGASGVVIALTKNAGTESVGKGDGNGGGLLGGQSSSATLYQGMPVSIETVPTENEEMSVAQVYSRVAMSVVAISTSRQMSSGFSGGFYVTTGAGSGVILTKEGHIITNYHVIDGATEVKVTLTDGREYKGVYLDGDPAKDIALLKIEPQSELIPAVIGSSDTLLIGQEIIAIGNPLGDYPGTVTDGIVSALNRKVEIGGYVRTLIQTNAAINPGNSGGGLFDRYGRLIGVVNAKNSAEGVEGLGFAIPIDLVLEDIVEIIEDGYIHGRACLDLDFKAITNPTDAFYLYRNQSAGIYIQLSRYDEALDLSAGDRIHAINGIEIRSESDLHSVLATLTPGDEVQLTVGRVKAVTSGFFTSYKEEYFEVTVPLKEYVPASSITFR